MKMLVIANPVAGAGMSRAAIAELVGDHLPGADLAVSAGPGAAGELAVEARAAGVDAIVAAGGDGLIHEIVNGLAPDFGPRLGLIPLGTGNDLARGLGVPRRPASAAAALASSVPRALDIGRLTEIPEPRHPPERRYFINVALAGFGARIELSGPMKRRWGGLAYVRSALADLGTLRAHETTITFDDGERLRLDAWMIVVANGRTAGGGVPLAPSADPADGLLDLVAIPAMPLHALPTLLPSVLAGRHLRHPRVVYRRTRRVSIAAGPGMWWNVDGEVLVDQPVTLDVLPRALEVLVPS